MSLDRWNSVVKFYKESLNIPEHIVDYLSVDEVLKLCASGLSSSTIAMKLRFETYRDVEDILLEFMDFAGWRRDLDINPWYIYKRYDNFNCFLNEMKLLTKVEKYGIITKAYNICEKYDTIRKEIDEYYGE